MLIRQIEADVPISLYASRATRQILLHWTLETLAQAFLICVVRIRNHEMENPKSLCVHEPAPQD